MPHRLLFLRHAETTYNVDRRLVGGRSDWLPLTEHGMTQPISAARQFKTEGITPVKWYSSPAVRARWTGEILLNELGIHLPLEIDERIAEMSQGHAEGKRRATVWTKERSLAAKTGGFDFRLKGGESFNDTIARMVSFAEDETVHAHEGDVLVTSHGLSTTLMVGHYLGWSRDEILEQSRNIPNCSLTSLVVWDGRVDVEYFGKDLLGATETA